MDRMGRAYKKEIDENLYLKINKQNHDIETHLHGCLIYKDNPNISDDNFKKEIAKYTKKKICHQCQLVLGA